MKKTFFALALLVPAVATAAVKLDITARCGTDKIEESLELNEATPTCLLKHDNDISTIISLKKEEAESVEFLVEIKVAERELTPSVVKMAYGEKINLPCTSEKVDAELTLVASKVVVADNPAQ